MNPREKLDEYLGALRERLKLAIFTRAGAAIALATLIVICTAVYVLNLRGFPIGGVIVSRIALFIAVAAIVATLVWLPLRRLRKGDGAEQFEERLPEQHGRLQTYLEQRELAHKHNMASPLVDLLAEDALKLAQKSPTDVVSP